MSAGLHDTLAEEFGRLARKVRAALRRTRTRSDDEAIHDLRVATRRLTSALDLWKPAWRAGPRRRLRRAARRLRRALGPAREAEVHEAQLREWLSPGPAVEPEGSAAILERMVRRVRRRRRIASRACVRPAARRFLGRVAAAPPLVREPPLMPSLIDRARARIARLEARARAAVEIACREENDAAAHAARIAVKHWRYALERLHAAAPSTDDAPLRVLSHAQRVLGHVHDLATLRRELERERERARAATDAEPERAATALLVRLARDERAAREAMRMLPAELADAGAAPEAGSETSAS